MLTSHSFAFLLLLLTSSLAASTPRSPTVRLDSATVTGVANGTLNKFLGIPYVKPPVGPLRLHLPRPIPRYTQNFAATTFGPICPQQAQTLVLPDDVPEIVREEFAGIGAPAPLPSSEDCLTVNVIAPANATPHSKLSVVVWIYGGGFEIGFPESTDGSILVNQSIALGSPIVYVSLNYRLNVFGFLASKEVRDAGIGNLGLQRQALRWVQQYITQFGGDPSKVTLWGESAGAISTSLQMVTNGGNNEGLFRAAIMDSGAPLWLGSITHGQQYYDQIVKDVGCARSQDTLDCLRNAPFEALMSATNSTPNLFVYQALAEAWIPRVDGDFLKDDPQRLFLRGSVANIPMINGVNDDEGTLFSASTLNITTPDELAPYLKTFYVPGASIAEIDHVLSFYPSDPAAGSPFNTSDANALTPQFKRIAAVLGDLAFQGPHRLFLQTRSDLQPTWSYLYKRGKATPFLGTFHSSELANAYGGGDLGAFFIRFITTLNPSAPNASVKWPKYTTKSSDMLTFLDGDVPLAVTQDDYRVEAIQAMIELLLKHPY
ncbi:carotenoid ester lipase precursor [Mycena metata]|uniref:Carboxylic ester hydrolase n=1 Tax=Mycena metata TaxID=1033252 RepID=A0AAD7MEW2_9AGAR|nr:carotenoid ester lipase precursor [Mycena metata]